MRPCAQLVERIYGRVYAESTDRDVKELPLVGDGYILLDFPQQVGARRVDLPHNRPFVTKRSCTMVCVCACMCLYVQLCTLVCGKRVCACEFAR
jgi:hypothetical protein